MSGADVGSEFGCEYEYVECVKIEENGRWSHGCSEFGCGYEC